ncbi:gastric triacylglycerol lipase-like [Daphnia carinata]|uniref:gastric triacylglycerol lipase-like n=1 Tax=Daphnia carinata TaxID=120202 RepID=UPI0025795F61|nr:gastric triacylglycerol lipase-like [Daphnia carinata]
MILPQHTELFCLCVLTSSLLSNGYCSSAFQFRLPFQTVPARKLFTEWRKKDVGVKKLLHDQQLNENVQEARLFDRLPYNVEISYTPTQVIRHRGYPAEVHHVTTDDGYILELHRIPAKPSLDGTPRKAVLLQHGNLQSSGEWLVNFPNRTLPLLLADKSYDVWLGNFRGNRFSRRHVTLSPKQTDFWRFSWDEIGNFDIPALINYILSVTGLPTISYIGHSLGCGVFFIAMVKHPELNAKIDAMIAFGPVSSFAHSNALVFRAMTSFGKAIDTMFRRIGTRVFMDNTGKGHYFQQLLCGQTYQQANLCAKFLNIYAGWNPHNTHPEVVPTTIANSQQGTSVAVLAQFAQNVKAGETFQAYDYGPKGNRIRYGTKKPLEYDLKKVTAPVYVYSGGNDRIVSPKDVDWLLPRLGNLKRSVRIKSYNHEDFVWGTDVKETLYDSVMADLPPP